MDREAVLYDSYGVQSMGCCGKILKALYFGDKLMTQISRLVIRNSSTLSVMPMSSGNFDDICGRTERWSWNRAKIRTDVSF